MDFSGVNSLHATRENKPRGSLYLKISQTDTTVSLCPMDHYWQTVGSARWCATNWPYPLWVCEKNPWEWYFLIHFFLIQMIENTFSVSWCMLLSRCFCIWYRMHKVSVIKSNWYECCSVPSSQFVFINGSGKQILKYPSSVYLRSSILSLNIAIELCPLFSFSCEPTIFHEHT